MLELGSEIPLLESALEFQPDLSPGWSRGDQS
jgi:hypothetical protein